MAVEGISSSSMASVVEDVLLQHRTKFYDYNLAPRKADEAAWWRYEAAGWLRKMIGVVGAKDFPAEPSEEEFRIGLRNGIVLCNVLNKIRPGAVAKIVEAPLDSVIPPDGAALSAFQYFENVRNFLVAMQELGLPTFDASDLEQGGKSARVVSCVLALKSYSEWKQMGGNGSWRVGGNSKVINSCFVRRNSDPFMSRNLTMNEKCLDRLFTEQSTNGDIRHRESSEMTSSHSLKTLVRAVLSDKKPEEVPTLVESLLTKIMEEFECRLLNQNEKVKAALSTSQCSKSFPQKEDFNDEMPMEYETSCIKNDIQPNGSSCNGEESRNRFLNHKIIFEQQKRDIQELKNTLQKTKADVQFMQTNYSDEFCNLSKHLHGLAHAASGYHRVLQENRKLYNQVQELKGNIRVYCRVRPFLHGQSNCLSTVDFLDDVCITIKTRSNYGKEGRRSFKFNRVFGPSASQDEVFSDTQSLIRSVLDGYNVCIFAYGQTGSGKTYTMTGPKYITEQSQGVNYRALTDLFNLSEQRKDTFCYDISVQMIEIYNEQVRDLLVTDGSNKKLEIRNNCQNGINVPDANLVPVESTSDVIELMNIGQRNRAVSATSLNDRSSRSHSCLTIHVQGRDITSGALIHGCMHLVDLAGSERVDKSEVTGDRLKEAQHINKSLSALGDVIAALAQKSSHVPYRNSKLTQLLQDSLGGQAKTLMFVHVSPDMDAVGETISTLKFAERVATVELGAARLNKESGDVRDLKEQIANLKAALSRKEAETFQNSDMDWTPEVQRTKVVGPSSIHSSQRGGNVLSDDSGPRQSMQDLRSTEAQRKLSMRDKRSFDLQEILNASNSNTWPDTNPDTNFPKNEQETNSSEWVDKLMVNKQDVFSEGDSLLRFWDGNNDPMTRIFHPNYLQDSSIYSAKPCDREKSRRSSREYETESTDDSYELGMATSESSEADIVLQFKPPKVTKATNGVGSRIKKKPQRTTTKSPETTISGHRHVASNLGKLSNGGLSVNRTGRQPVSNGTDGKRFSSVCKTANGKY